MISVILINLSISIKFNLNRRNLLVRSQLILSQNINEIGRNQSAQASSTTPRKTHKQRLIVRELFKHYLKGTTSSKTG